MGLLRKRRDGAWEAEFRAAWRQEQRFFRRYAEPAPAPLDRALDRLVPEKLAGALEAAFCKAFALVFEKGAGPLLRAGRRRERDCRVRQYAADLQEDRRTLGAFSRAAESGGWGNVLLSGAAGAGMGVLGIGLPDIPVFTAMLLKSLYETAASFGFPCGTAAERRFVLALIETALCTGAELRSRSRALDAFAQTERWPQGTPGLAEQMESAARRLSAAMLYGKFLQGVPVVGVLGGAEDAVCLRRIQRYAAIKYRKRFLIRRRLRAPEAEND